MKNFSKADVNSIFANICCSNCKNNFTQNSIEVLEQFEDLYIINLTCDKCLKNFGEVVLNFDVNQNNHGDFKIIEGAPVINFDDVIDAHRFIKDNL